VFEIIQQRRTRIDAVLCAFDLLELDGVDLKREPIKTRKRTLKSLQRGAVPGIAYNEHFEGRGGITH
jgi:ATP-dependent DNA ligase